MSPAERVSLVTTLLEGDILTVEEAIAMLNGVDFKLTQTSLYKLLKDSE